MERKTEAKHEIFRKPLDWFIPKDNIRKHYAEDYLDRLGNSLMVRQWHPVIAMANRELVDGFGRLLAAQRKNRAFLDTIILEGPLSQTELRLVQGQTAMHRADLTAFEKYELLYELLQLNPNWQEKELAEHLCIDPSTVCKLLSFSKTIPPVRQALKDRLISINDGHAFSQLSEAHQAELLPKRLAGEIANREEMVREVRARKNPGRKSAERATRFKAMLPGSSVSIALAAQSLDMATLIDSLSKLLKLAKKADQEQLDVKTWESVLRDKAKKAS